LRITQRGDSALETMAPQSEPSKTKRVLKPRPTIQHRAVEARMKPRRRLTGSERSDHHERSFGRAALL
jgi:hypothetical protein